MLEDRSYMRSIPGSKYRPGWLILIIAITVCFALQQINAVYVKLPFWYLALSATGIKEGYLWQLITFQFLHADLLHLFFNAFGIWIFGRFVEETLGRRRLFTLYFACGFVGGLLQVLLGFLAPNYFGFPAIGASAGVLGLIAAFARMMPEGEIRLFFLIPIRAKYLLYAEFAIALFFVIVPSEPGIAHAAHLGGIIAAVLYVHYIVEERLRWRFPTIRIKRSDEPVEIIRPKRNFWRGSKTSEPTDMPSDDFIRSQVDPILEKISAHGIHSLTDQEKQILEAARSRMAKR